MFQHLGLDADFEERRSLFLAFQSRHSTRPWICSAGWLYIHDFEHAHGAGFSGPTATCIQNQKVGARHRNLNSEQRQAIVDRAGYKLIEFLVIVICAVSHRGISVTQLVSEPDGLGGGQAYLHPHVAPTVGVQHGRRLFVELEAEVKEDSPRKRHVDELVERDWVLQQLFLVIIRPELEDELVRVGEEVELVVFINI